MGYNQTHMEADSHLRTEHPKYVLEANQSAVQEQSEIQGFP